MAAVGSGGTGSGPANNSVAGGYNSSISPSNQNAYNSYNTLNVPGSNVHQQIHQHNIHPNNNSNYNIQSPQQHLQQQSHSNYNANFSNIPNFNQFGSNAHQNLNDLANATTSGDRNQMKSGGRFDFDDGGIYVGDWHENKAHGYGICTGPRCEGEYSGSWNYGFEVSGVYKWPSGAIYQGQFQNGQRHGVGVEYRDKCSYKGEWTQGLKGRHGVRCSLLSPQRYEGTWANGLQDGYGSETYADLGTYQGQWQRGMRHGYGVRKSAAYGSGPGPNSTVQITNVRGSIQSLASEFGRSKSSQGVRPSSVTGSTEGGQRGFVLVGRPRFGGSESNLMGSSGRRSSLADKNGPARKSGGLLRGLRLKKQRSTGDIDMHTMGSTGRMNLVSSSTDSIGGRLKGKTSSSAILGKQLSTDASSNAALVGQDADITDPSTVETYMGEWKNDRRCGFGICERTDGLSYAGEWLNNKKYGYGQTIYKDGRREEGKYKDNLLVSSVSRKGLFLIRSSKLKERVEAAVREAQKAQKIAMQKADIAISRTAAARDKAEQAEAQAAQACTDSQMAVQAVKKYGVYSAADYTSAQVRPTLVDALGNMPNTSTVDASGNLMPIGEGFLMLPEAPLRRRLSAYSVIRRNIARTAAQLDQPASGGASASGPSANPMYPSLNTPNNSAHLPGLIPAAATAFAPAAARPPSSLASGPLSNNDYDSQMLTPSTMISSNSNAAYHSQMSNVHNYTSNNVSPPIASGNRFGMQNVNASNNNNNNNNYNYNQNNNQNNNNQAQLSVFNNQQVSPSSPNHNFMAHHQPVQDSPQIHYDLHMSRDPMQQINQQHQQRQMLQHQMSQQSMHQSNINHNMNQSNSNNSNSNSNPNMNMNNHMSMNMNNFNNNNNNNISHGNMHGSKANGIDMVGNYSYGGYSPKFGPNSPSFIQNRPNQHMSANDADYRSALHQQPQHNNNSSSNNNNNNNSNNNVNSASNSSAGAANLAANQSHSPLHHNFMSSAAAGSQPQLNQMSNRMPLMSQQSFDLGGVMNRNQAQRQTEQMFAQYYGAPSASHMPTNAMSAEQIFAGNQSPMASGSQLQNSQRFGSGTQLRGTSSPSGDRTSGLTAGRPASAMTNSNTITGTSDSNSQLNNRRSWRTASLYRPGTEHAQQAKATSGSAALLKRKPSLQLLGSKTGVAASNSGISPMLSREEVSVLSSAEREHRRKEAELAQKLARNPFLYFVNAHFRNWLAEQQLILFVMAGNLALVLVFYHFFFSNSSAE